MLFSSTEFIYYFMPAVLFGYYFLSLINRTELSKFWLVGASLFFYGFWKPIYLPLIVASVLINFTIAKLILIRQNESENLSLSPLLIYRGFPGKNIANRFSSKHFLLIGILFNVGLLGFFKYFDFFIYNFSLIMAVENPIHLKLLLPLGISFFTLQQIAYLVDCKLNLIQKHELKSYFLFVTFFPQLIAGPIVHHKEMMPQFGCKFDPLQNLRNISKGILLFSIGLFKKIVIADNLGLWADKGFAHACQLTLVDAWGTSLSYTFQIYFDFSGYTDMAMGIALFFGILLPLNFNSPYKASNIQEFWRRWHMTLSRWLRDYIYIPLGGNRTSLIKNYFNLLAVFLIGGFWHGAGWTFILWGVLHGLATIAHRVWRKSNIEMPEAMARFLTFIFINITWVVFRANDIQTAKTLIFKMFDFNNSGITKSFMNTLFVLTGWNIFKYKITLAKNINILGEPTKIFFFLSAVIILVNYFENSYNYTKYLEKNGVFTAIYIAQFSAILFLVALAFSYIVPESNFLYFNF